MRGLWLVLLEFTLVKFTWTFDFGFPFWFLQVIAAIAGVGIAIVAGHNLLDGVTPPGPQGWTDAVAALYMGNRLVALPNGHQLSVIYPLLQWVGVLAVGYGLGPVFLRDTRERRRVLRGIGVAACALFLVLRGWNLYGEPSTWAPGDTAILSVASFLNCQKYPPSLQYLLMTLGPALLLLAHVDREPGKVGRVFITFGRVPLFYYLMHVLVIHGASVLMYGWLHGQYLSPLQAIFLGPYPLPSWFGKGLGTVYAGWIGAVLVLYAPCAWFARVKRRSTSPILKFL